MASISFKNVCDFTLGENDHHTKALMQAATQVEEIANAFSLNQDVSRHYLASRLQIAALIIRLVCGR